MITHPEIDSDLGLLLPESIVKPVMEHRWLSLSFIHWPFEPAKVQRMLPRRLEVDTFEGAAWIGLVPFRLEVRLPPSVPAVPHLSTTLEVNARTYVRGPRRAARYLVLLTRRVELDDGSYRAGVVPNSLHVGAHAVR